MFIHNYDSHTGQYVNSVLADPDPMTTDGWIVPAFSATEPPPPRTRGQWPFWINGAWVLKPDYRGVMLYSRDGGIASELLVAGISLDEAKLTETPRPGDDYVWSDAAADGAGGWIEDPVRAAARAKREVEANLQDRMAVVTQKQFGKPEALAAGLLSPGEIAVFRAWAKYGLALAAILHHPDFPKSVVWPELPDEAAVLAQSVLDEQAKAKQAEEAAAVKAALEAQQAETAAMVAAHEEAKAQATGDETGDAQDATDDAKE